MKIVSHPDLARLHPTGAHPESQARLAGLLEAFPHFEPARPAANADLERCHDAAYVDLVRSIERPTLLDPDTVCSESSYEAALLAAGAAIGAAESGGFALVRPPGHHALPAPAPGEASWVRPDGTGRCGAATMAREHAIRPEGSETTF